MVFGQVGLAERPCDGMITVHHHFEGYPPTQWPVNSGYFKVLVHLDPGPNRLRFYFSGAKIPCTSSTILINFLPLTSSPPLYMAIILAKDSSGEYECQIDRKQREGNDVRMAKRKLRMAVYVDPIPEKVVEIILTNQTKFKLSGPGIHRGADV